MLSVRGLVPQAGGQPLCAPFDWDVRPGECWGVLGPNGAGKSTLLHSLAGLQPPAAGRILLDDLPIDALAPRARARRLGLMAQDDGDAFPASVLETLLTGRYPWLGPWGWEGEADRAAARAALAAVDLAGFEARDVRTLSGGERRRVALATLLVQAPAVMLLDEPLNHVDLAHQQRILALLRERAATGRQAVVMVLHDLNQAQRNCDRVLLLGGGRAEAGPTAELLEPARLFGCALRRLDCEGRGVWIAD